MILEPILPTVLSVRRLPGADPALILVQILSTLGEEQQLRVRRAPPVC